MNDVNRQVLHASLKARFPRLQETGTVTPTALRAAYRGPLLFTVTTCDSAVHWECVEYVARQFADGGGGGSDGSGGDGSRGVTVVHCLSGPLRHAPNIEDPEQYNQTLLAFLQGEPLPPPTATA